MTSCVLALLLVLVFDGYVGRTESRPWEGRVKDLSFVPSITSTAWACEPQVCESKEQGKPAILTTIKSLKIEGKYETVAVIELEVNRPGDKKRYPLATYLLDNYGSKEVQDLKDVKLLTQQFESIWYKMSEGTVEVWVYTLNHYNAYDSSRDGVRCRKVSYTIATDMTVTPSEPENVACGYRTELYKSSKSTTPSCSVVRN